MQIQQDINSSAYTIKRVEEGAVYVIHPISQFDENGKPVINEEKITQSAVITPSTLVRDWPVNCIEELKAEHIKGLLSDKVEVILLGTGNKIQFPEPSITAPALERGVGVEVMNISAACRTYNILMAEGRQVAAALIME